MSELLIKLTELRDFIRTGETEQAIEMANFLILRERRKLPRQGDVKYPYNYKELEGRTQC